MTVLVTEQLSTVHDAWERPIREVLRELGLFEDRFHFVLMFYNALFDPREINDLLHNTGGLTQADALKTLVNTYYGALRGMAE